MKKNGAVDIICKIVSVLLSIILVPMLIVTVLFASVNNLMKPESIIEIIADIDYEELFEKASGEASTLNENAQMGATEKVAPKTTVATTKLNPQKTMSVVPFGNGSNSSAVMVPDSSQNSSMETGEIEIPPIEINGTFEDIGNGINNFIGDIAGEFGIESAGETGEMVKNFLKTDVCQEIFDEYADALSDCIAGDEDAQIDEDKIVRIIIENKDEIFDFVEEYTGQEIDRQAVSEDFDRIVQENAGMFIENLPAPKEIVDQIPSEFIDVINFINDKTILNFLILVDCVLVALIFVLRLWDFAGFLWLSVNGIISGVILAIIYGIISFVRNIILGAIPELESILNTLIDIATNKLLWGFIIILIASAVFMTVFFVIKSLRKNKQNI